MADNETPDWKIHGDDLWSALGMKRPGKDDIDAGIEFDEKFDLDFSHQGADLACVYVTAAIYVPSKAVILYVEGEAMDGRLHTARESLMDYMEKDYFNQFTGPQLDQEAREDLADKEFDYRTSRGVG